MRRGAFLGVLLFAMTVSASCPSLLVGKEVAGYDFIHKRNPALHISHFVEQQAKRTKRRDGQSMQKPREKLQSWLESLDERYQRFTKKNKIKDKVFEYYLRNFAINKDNFPDSYFEEKKSRDRRRGILPDEIDEMEKNRMMSHVIYDQHQSLLPWLDYLLFSDAKTYPSWARYWALSGVLKLTKFNPVTGSFGRRDGVQVVNFPELNTQAIAITMNAIVQKIEAQQDPNFDDERFRKLLAEANFGKIYGHAFKNLSVDQYSLEETDGLWVKYNGSRNLGSMVKSLQGLNAGWCIVHPSTARDMMERGRFFIYYSKDKRGIARIPRVAIRMYDRQVAEVRGIMPDQDFDPYIAQTTIVQDKLAAIGKWGVLYMKKSEDMKKMTEIENKHYQKIPLSIAELRFLYEMDEKIFGFGFGPDPRIAEIINSRDLVDDMLRIGECGAKVSHPSEDPRYYLPAY